MFEHLNINDYKSLNVGDPVAVGRRMLTTGGYTVVKKTRYKIFVKRDDSDEIREFSIKQRKEYGSSAFLITQQAKLWLIMKERQSKQEFVIKLAYDAIGAAARDKNVHLLRKEMANLENLLVNYV